MRRKSKSWIHVAAAEIHETQKRWNYASYNEFSRELGVNNRTLAKLNPRRPDHTLELETLDYIYHRLLTLCHVYYIGEEARKEYNLLVESRIRVLMSVRPLPQKVLDRLAERTKDVSL